MIRIGILSDTHYPDKTSYLDLIFERFQEKSVDLIIHAGDLTVLDVKEVLESIVPCGCR